METNKYNYQDQELLEITKKRVAKLKGFYTHLFIYIVGVIIYVFKTYFGFSFNFFPTQFINSFVMAIWTTIFVMSAIELFVANKVFGKKWEDQKIKNLIGKQSENKIWK